MFSFSYQPFVYFWKKCVFKSFPIFKLGCLFLSLFWGVGVLCIYQTLIPYQVFDLQIFSPILWVVFSLCWCTKFFSFDDVRLPNFYCCYCLCFWSYPRNRFFFSLILYMCVCVCVCVYVCVCIYIYIRITIYPFSIYCNLAITPTIHVANFVKLTKYPSVSKLRGALPCLTYQQHLKIINCFSSLRIVFLCFLEVHTL